MTYFCVRWLRERPNRLGSRCVADSSVLFAVLLLETLRRALTNSSRLWCRKWCDTIVIAVSTVWVATFLITKATRYWEARIQSRNFLDALPTIGKLSLVQLREPPYILHHPAAVRAPWLLRSEDWRSLWRFVPTVASNPAPKWLHSPVQWAYTWEPLKRQAGDLRTYLHFDEHMKLSKIDSPPNE